MESVSRSCRKRQRPDYYLPMERMSTPKRPRLSVSCRRRQDWSPEALPDGTFSRPPRRQPRESESFTGSMLWRKTYSREELKYIT